MQLRAVSFLFALWVSSNAVSIINTLPSVIHVRFLWNIHVASDPCFCLCQKVNFCLESHVVMLLASCFGCRDPGHLSCMCLRLAIDLRDDHCPINTAAIIDLMGVLQLQLGGGPIVVHDRSAIQLCLSILVHPKGT